MRPQRQILECSRWHANGIEKGIGSTWDLGSVDNTEFGGVHSGPSRREEKDMQASCLGCFIGSG